MAEDTFVEAEIWSVARTDQGNAVLLRPTGSEVAVPIFIGPLETQAIVIGLGDVQVPRPLTHDLLVDLLGHCGRSVARVEISDLREGTFYGRIILRSPEGEELAVDSRPSDALAIAVRVKCRIFIAEHVVDEAGVPADLMAPPVRDDGNSEKDRGPFPAEADPGAEEAVGETARGPADGFTDERSRLELALEKAVEDEDYETAALLRDRLRELDQGPA